MNVLITICGRAGSKRLPKKNIKKINNKPLVQYTIDTAKIIGRKIKADIAVSTDDDEIIRIAEKNNIKTNYKRPEFLARDSCGKIDVIKDLMLFEEKDNSKKYDYVIDLDITSPLRTSDEVVEALEILESDKEAFNIFSVSKPYRNPYFNMTERKENGYFDVVCKGKKFLTTQESPDVYDINGSFYVYRKSFFENGFSNAYSDKTLVYIVKHICFDVDNLEDFEYLDYVISKGKFMFSD